MRLTQRGQVTIPVRIREQLGIRQGDDIEFVLDGDMARLTCSRDTDSPGQRLVKHMRGRGDSTLSTEEIMALMRGD